MIDNHMRHYYTRIYNAKPSVEIARTRPVKRSSSASRAPSRSEGGSVPSGLWNSRLGRSQSSLELSKKQQVVTRSVDYRIKAKHHRPPEGALPISSDDERLSLCDHGETRRHQEYWYSSTESFRNRPVENMRDPIAPSSLEHIHQHSVSNHNMSDKISNFLTVVQRCELELADEFETRRRRIESRKRKPILSRSTSNISYLTNSLDQGRKTSLLSRQSGSMSTLVVPSVSYAPVIKKMTVPKSNTTQVAQVYGKARGPKMGQRGPGVSRPSTATVRLAQTGTPAPSTSTLVGSKLSFSSMRKQIQEYPLPDTSKVSSRLRQDRNYQPARRRKPTIKSGSSQTRLQTKRSSVDYEDDFEEVDGRKQEESEDAEAEEDEVGDDMEEEEFNMTMTQQWLDDQRARGLARQKAMLLQKHQGSYEKESSKDSAYGYSGGESRLQTPDNFRQSSYYIKKHDRQQQLKHQLTAKGYDSVGRNHTIQQEANEEKVDKSTAYVNFVNKVTSDILQKGIFTERGLKEVLENHMRRHDGISPQEAQTLLSKLKKEFGIASASSRSLNSSMNEANLRDILYDMRRTRPRAKVSPYPEPMMGRRIGEGHQSDWDLSDAELANILKDIDLDPTDIQHLAQQSPSRYAQPSRPNSGHLGGNTRSQVLSNVDISDLNISFKTNGDQSNREKQSQQRALLIKSFARNRPKSSQAQPSGPMRAVHPHQRSPGNRRPAHPMSQPRKTTRPRGSARQDSSSSNPDQSPTHAHPPSRPSSSKRRPPKTSTPPDENQMPDTPLHSSETPRSSSLYQPETEEDESAPQQEVNRTPRSLNDEESDISEDCEAVHDHDDSPDETLEEALLDHSSN